LLTHCHVSIIFCVNYQAVWNAGFKLSADEIWIQLSGYKVNFQFVVIEDKLTIWLFVGESTSEADEYYRNLTYSVRILLQNSLKIEMKLTEN